MIGVIIKFPAATLKTKQSTEAGALDSVPNSEQCPGRAWEQLWAQVGKARKTHSKQNDPSEVTLKHLDINQPTKNSIVSM